MGSIDGIGYGLKEYDHVILKKRLPGVLQWDGIKQTITLPRGSKILKLGNQSDYPTIWFVCAWPFENIPLIKRNIYMFATGQMISSGLERMSYIGTDTFQGNLVYHFYTGYEEGTTFGL